MSNDIGQKLVAASLITERALEQAELQVKTSGGAVTAQLVRLGAITEEGLLDFLSQHFRVPSVDLNKMQVDENVVRLLPAEMATKFMAVPLERTGRRLTVAMAQPTNLFALDDIKFVTGLEVEPVVATRPLGVGGRRSAVVAGGWTDATPLAVGAAEAEEAPARRMTARRASP